MDSKWTVDESTEKEQWGVIFPNDEEAWGEEVDLSLPFNSGPYSGKHDLSAEEGRGKVRDLWKSRVEGLGLNWSDKFRLRFVKRRQAFAVADVQEVDR